MPIVSSTIYKDRAEPSGWRWVTEQHVDHTGAVHTRRRFEPPGYDAEAGLSASATNVLTGLVDAERWQALDLLEAGTHTPATVPLIHLDRTELYRWLVKRMANADAETALRYVQYIDMFSDAQVAALIGKTEQEISAWRADLEQIAASKVTLDAYASPFSFPEVAG